MKWYQKKYFFGWSNIKYLLIQIYFTFSNRPSELSRKRIESCMLFISALSCTLVWFIYHFKTLDYLEMLAVTGALFVYAGYTMRVMQKEKIKANGSNTDQPACELEKSN